MADAVSPVSELSGRSIRGAADAMPALSDRQTVLEGQSQNLEETLRHAADLIKDALDLTGNAMETAVETAVETASDKAFEAAANAGANIASPYAAQQASQNAFSWSGYFQALGFLCLLLAILWLAVWLIRRYGRFNFLPRPGALPKDALVMEAQMPIGPKKGLMVVRFMDRRLLLGVTERQITLLTEDRTPYERQKKDFQSYLAPEPVDSDRSQPGS